MDSKYIQTTRGKMHAQVEGQGRAVVLIHGRNPLFNSWRTWEKNIRELGEQARVYAVDLLGYGESDQPQPILDTRAHAETIRDMIHVESLQPVCLVGLSWGGLIAQTVVEAGENEVAGLVLVDSGLDPSPEGLARLKNIAIPTLIIWDAEDTVIPVAAANLLAQAIPNSRLRIFTHAERDRDANPEERHWSQVSHSAAWNKIVKEFLASGQANEQV